MPRLWEPTVDDFPCPFADDEQHFDSWAALRANADLHDNGMNVVIWWDWSLPEDGYPSDQITLYVAMPNRERVFPWSAPVTREQEPEIRAWLEQRLARLAAWWHLDAPSTARPATGVWVARYPDRSAAVPFASEIEALRHAVTNHMGVAWVPYGADVFTENQGEA
ncbi:hypothetical protein [Actinomadura geliboluensis]|uniref:hypothetical protein n=1 Tax=Actinomadura geliboluensis TaxID=882440 RepID=UPI0036AF9360